MNIPIGKEKEDFKNRENIITSFYVEWNLLIARRNMTPCCKAISIDTGSVATRHNITNSNKKNRWSY